MSALSGNALINWTLIENVNGGKFSDYIDKNNKGETLNLSDNTRYIFRVRAKNNLGLWSIEKSSDGVTTDFSVITGEVTSSCSNNIKDSSESGIDCGGECGPTCGIGKDCDSNSDCRSGYCSDSNKCQQPSCFDDDKNGNETDIDCGSSCGKCEKGSVCNRNTDCDTGNCRNGICTEESSCTNGLPDPGESDEDCGGICEAKCIAGYSCDVNADCETGLECIAGTCVADEAEEEDDSDSDGIPNSWEEGNAGMDRDDATDAELDFDGDSLTNLEEYTLETDPNNPDSDGDGYSDSKEAKKGTNPKDPKDKPGSAFGIFFLVIFILLAGSAIGYLAYMQYFNKKPKSPPSQRPFQPQRLMPRSPMQMPQRRPQFVMKRPDLRKQPIRPEKQKIPDKEEFIPLFEPKEEKSKEEGILSASQPKDEVFKKLSDIVGEGAAKSKEPKKSVGMEKVKKIAKGKKNKKGEASQVFVYIITIVIIGVIFIFGYNSIQELNKNSEKVSQVRLKTDIENAISSITPEYGSFKQASIKLPGSYSEVCFLKNFISGSYPENDFTGYPLIFDAKDTGKNVFLLDGKKRIVDSYTIGSIDFEEKAGKTPSLNCFKGESGTVDIKFTGKGDHVLIS